LNKAELCQNLRQITQESKQNESALEIERKRKLQDKNRTTEYQYLINKREVKENINE